MRRWQRRGVKLGGNAQGHPIRPGVTGKGKTGRVNVSEPPFFCLVTFEPCQTEAFSRVQGLAAVKRQVPVGQRAAVREDTTVPGV